MANEVLNAVTARVKLEDGRDSSGNIKYVYQSIQYVGRDGYTADKVLAVASALAPCISNDYAGAEAVKTFLLENS